MVSNKNQIEFRTLLADPSLVDALNRWANASLALAKTLATAPLFVSKFMVHPRHTGYRLLHDRDVSSMK